MTWLATAPSAGAQIAGALAPGDHELVMRVGASERYYLAHVPPQAAAGTPLPAVINMHGGGGSPADHRGWTGMDAVADREGFVVVYPAGYARGPGLHRRLLTWNAGTCCGAAREDGVDDVGFLVAVLDDLGRRVALDRTRIYATGHSNGAMMAFALAAAEPARIAAIAPIAGIGPPRAGDTGGPPVPVLYFHSVDDPRAVYAGGLGPPFPFTSYRSRHLPVEAALAEWATHNRCTGPLAPSGPARTSGPHRAAPLEARGCPPDAPVQLWRMEGPGHVWPGAPPRESRAAMLGPATDVVDATREMWAFFSRFRRLQAPPPGPAATPAGVEARAGGVTPDEEALSLAASTRGGGRLTIWGAADPRPDGGGRIGERAVAASGWLSPWSRVRREPGPVRAHRLALHGGFQLLDLQLPDDFAERLLVRASLSASLTSLFSTRHGLVLHGGGLVEEQKELLAFARIRPVAAALGIYRPRPELTVTYGAGFTYLLGRGLLLPLLGGQLRLSERWRLDLLLPAQAELVEGREGHLQLSVGARLAGRRAHLTGRNGSSDQESELRLALLRVGLGAQIPVASTLALGLDGGLEAGAQQEGGARTTVRGPYLSMSLAWTSAGQQTHRPPLQALTE